MTAHAARPGLAVYAGSFDPVTNGHIDLIERASKLFAEVVVALGVHPTRMPLFTADERLALLREVDRALHERQSQLASMACSSTSANRWARASSSADCAPRPTSSTSSRSRTPTPTCIPDIDTIFLPTRTNYGFVSASLVREIALHGGDVSRYAPPAVRVALREKFATRKKGT